MTQKWLSGFRWKRLRSYSKVTQKWRKRSFWVTLESLSPEPRQWLLYHFFVSLNFLGVSGSVGYFHVTTLAECLRVHSRPLWSLQFCDSSFVAPRTVGIRKQDVKKEKGVLGPEKDTQISLVALRGCLLRGFLEGTHIWGCSTLPNTCLNYLRSVPS